MLFVILFNKLQFMNAKKLNARIQKWREMIKQGIKQDPQLLRSRIRKGIPQAIRAIAWPQIVGLKQFIKQKKGKYTYEKLINTPSSSIYQISLDIPRTFPEQEDSKILRKSLNNVLKAISLVYPKVGYCQGMNFLALRLLEVLDDEQTFWLLHFLLQHDPSLMKNFIEPKRIEQECGVFAALMKSYLPQIAAKIEQYNISSAMFSVRWFMTIFSSVLKQETFYRVFQIYLNQGWSALYACGLTFLKSNQHKILNESFQGIILLMNSQIYHVTNDDEFIDKICLLNIPSNTIRELTNKINKSLELRVSRQETLAERVEKSKNFKLPKPQHQPKEAIQFQRKAQEVCFQAFQLLVNKRK